MADEVSGQAPLPAAAEQGKGNATMRGAGLVVMVIVAVVLVSALNAKGGGPSVGRWLSDVVARNTSEGGRSSYRDHDYDRRERDDGVYEQRRNYAAGNAEWETNHELMRCAHLGCNADRMSQRRAEMCEAARCN